MSLLDYFNALSGIATALGVFLAWHQIKVNGKQAVTQFEDDLTKQFRDIISRIPVAAMLSRPFSSEELEKHLDAFYRYFDLTNQQVFLRYERRISDSTWNNWKQGIVSYLARPAFAEAWEIVKKEAVYDFDELRRLQSDGFRQDPANWIGDPNQPSSESPGPLLSASEPPRVTAAPSSPAAEIYTAPLESIPQRETE